MSDKLSIEQLVRSRLEEAEITPSVRVWPRIRRGIRWQQFLQFKPWQLNIYTLGGFLLIVSGSWMVIDQSTGQEEDLQYSQIEAVSDQRAVGDEGSNPEKETHRNLSGNNQQSGKNESAIETSISARPEEHPEESPMLHENRLEKSSSASIENSVPPPSGTEEVNTSVLPPEAFFTPTVSEGCAPLTVHFLNQSSQAAEFKWLFDDAGVTTEKDPSFTFEDPGTYTVTLIAVNEEGWSRRYTQMVRVLPRPNARFEFSESIQGFDGTPEVTVFNLSERASTYRWEIPGSTGQWSSNQYQPILKATVLNKTAKYLQLVAVNESGCADTVRLQIPEELLADQPSLQFPTAFSPNPTGSIGGNYSPNERRTDIFHPVFVEAPLEYHLRIYTRRGELVFETDNIYFGWDGYYLQERSASDVYVWMAEGRGSDGEEFKLRGDVTLLWNGYR